MCNASCEFVIQKIIFDLCYLKHFQVQLPIIIVIVIDKPEGGQEDYQEYVNVSDMKTLFSIVILSQEHGRHHQVCDAAKKS